MYQIYLDWSDFKTEIIAKGFPLNYRKLNHLYEIFSIDRDILWSCNLTTSETLEEFLSKYKIQCNLCHYTEDGKEIVRADARPIGCMTCWTGKGDSANNIGDGKEIAWDFSNNEDLIENPPVGMKGKAINFQFRDEVWIKDGTFYYFDAQKGSYFNVSLICPAGAYYLDNSGSVQQAIEDTVIVRFIIDQPICGSVPMGDELNSESSSPKIPIGYKFQMNVYVPESDTACHGHAVLELYRKRTVIL